MSYWQPVYTVPFHLVLKQHLIKAQCLIKCVIHKSMTLLRHCLVPFSKIYMLTVLFDLVQHVPQYSLKVLKPLACVVYIVVVAVLAIL